MALVLGAIADDYTGASDLANTLTRSGLYTLQTIGIPPAGALLPDADAVVMAFKIRSVPAAQAIEAALAARAWLRARGAEHVMYKICSTFDSTDRGNIGPVSEALREPGGPPTLVTPAFPQTGRTVYCGHLFVAGVPLNESPLKDHPLNPMHDADLVRVLARQSKHPVGLVAFPSVSAGAGAVRVALAGLTADGCGAAIADAVQEHDLEVLGEVAAAQPVSTGASGLGLGLARALLRTGRVKRGPAAGVADAAPETAGLSAVLAGSCSKATLEQIAVAARTMPVHQLDLPGLLTGGDEAGKALTWAGPRLTQGPVLIAASSDPKTVGDIQARFGADHSGHAIEQALAAIAAGLVERGMRRLVVAGGETSGAVVDKLGVLAFAVGEEIAPGVPVLRTLGAGVEPLVMALKSGNFGGPDFFARALEAVSRGR